MIDTARQSLSNESKMVFWMPHRYLETSGNLSKEVTPEAIRGWLKSSPVASRSCVSRFQSQGKDSAPTTKETCGLPLAILSSESSHNMHSWKTSAALLIPDILDESYKTWRKSGMMQDGRIYPLPIAVPRINGNGYGYLLPTPTAMDAIARKGIRPSRIATNRKSGYLSEMVMLPTPRSNMTGNITQERVTDKFNNLESVVAKEAFPTPTNSMVTMQDMEQQRNDSKNRKKYSEINGGPLNPEWIEWLMGFPIEWSALEPLEMPKFRLWQQQHLGF